MRPRWVARSTTLARYIFSQLRPETHVMLSGNMNSQMPAFQCRRRFSVKAAEASSPTSTVKCAVSQTNTDLTTKWADPGQTISPEREYVMCFAGKTSGSTGSAGSGMVLYDDEGSELWWGNQSLGGEITSNEADYITLVTGLKCARSLGVQRIVAQGSNDLVHRQMEGTYKVKKPSLKKHYEKAVSLRGEFGRFQIRRVEKSRNKRAAELAKEAMATKKLGDSVSRQEGAENIATVLSASSSPNSDVLFDPSLISPGKTYILRFDGGSRGNPGTSGAGMVLYDSEDGSELWSGYKYIGDRYTNNEAEYMGLVIGLQCARSLGVKSIVVQGDSQLILRQVEGKYKVKSQSLKYYYELVTCIRKEFTSFETSHIERCLNGRADELANKAMDTKTSHGFLLENDDRL